MALHNETVKTERLDKVARRVLVAALKFERAKHEARNYGATEEDGAELCKVVAEYREALVDEVIGVEPTLGG